MNKQFNKKVHKETLNQVKNLDNNKHPTPSYRIWNKVEYNKFVTSKFISLTINNK